MFENFNTKKALKIAAGVTLVAGAGVLAYRYFTSDEGEVETLGENLGETIEGVSEKVEEAAS